MSQNQDIIRQLQDLFLSWLQGDIITQEDYENAVELLHKLFVNL